MKTIRNHLKIRIVLGLILWLLLGLVVGSQEIVFAGNNLAEETETPSPSSTVTQVIVQTPTTIPTYTATPSQTPFATYTQTATATSIVEPTPTQEEIVFPTYTSTPSVTPYGTQMPTEAAPPTLVPTLTTTPRPPSGGRGNLDIVLVLLSGLIIFLLGLAGAIYLFKIKPDENGS